VRGGCAHADGAVSGRRQVAPSPRLRRRLVALVARVRLRRALARAGFAPPHISETHRRLGTFLGAVMWFWIMYRAREDLPVLLGMRKPWEGHDHGDHGDHGDHDEHGEHKGQEQQLR